jgi:glutathione S-transferase
LLLGCKIIARRLNAVFRNTVNFVLIGWSDTFEQAEFMILVEDSRAPNPRRVRIFLAEKGIEVPRQNIDIMAGEHKLPERVRHNPLTRVPYLLFDDGQVLAETMAICRYFEALQPEPVLFGRTPMEIGVVEMWQRRVEHNLLGAIAAVFRHTNARMADLEVPQVPAWGEANIDKVSKMLDFMNDELEDRRYVAGEEFTVADITLLCAVDFMKVIRLRPGEDHENLKQWHDAVSSRASALA